MADTNTLEQLIELAKGNCDNAAREFATAKKREGEALAKAKLLEGYRADYLSKQRAIYRSEAALVENFHQFVEKLKQAIDHQNREITTAQHALEVTRANLERCQLRLRSLEKLALRRAETLSRDEKRAQQKMQDEFSSRNFLRDASLLG